MADNIYVIGEAKDGAVSKATQECIAEARRANGSAQITCVLLGSGVAGAAESAGKAGADAVAVADDAALASYHLETYVETIAAAVGGADLVLFPATTYGKEMAAQLAAKLGVGLAAECTKVTIGGDGDPRAVRPMYAGKVLATVKLTGPKPRLVTLRPNVVDVLGADAAKSAGVTNLSVVQSSVNGAKLVESTQKAAAGGEVDLSEASVVVSGGRGLQSPDNFGLLDQLAATMNAAVGASRMVVDAGWKEHRYQVGQTGRVVTPDLYIAVGISGAIQHLVGMQNSGCIVAINNNPEAPIFKVADYGIVGDLFEVVPKLTDALKN